MLCLAQSLKRGFVPTHYIMAPILGFGENVQMPRMQNLATDLKLNLSLNMLPTYMQTCPDTTYQKTKFFSLQKSC